MRKVLLLVCLLLGISACAPVPTRDPRTIATADTSTPRPIIPTKTSTPVPPLVAHTWSQSEPLIIYGPSGGLVPWPRQLDAMDFTLLPGGDLYLLRHNQHHNPVDIVTTRLSRQAVCNLLNSIDQAGLYGSDHYNYELMHSMIDAGPPLLSVHAWRTYPVYATSTRDFIGTPTPEPGDCRGCMGIENTFRLLEQYQPPTPLQPLEPERLGVWFEYRGEFNGTANSDSILWPLKSQTLASAEPSLKGYSRSIPSLILTGADATRVYDTLGKSFYPVTVREAGRLYSVFARPLLPNEFNTTPLPRVTLSCSPSDGWTPAPLPGRGE